MKITELLMEYKYSQDIKDRTGLQAILSELTQDDLKKDFDLKKQGRAELIKGIGELLSPDISYQEIANKLGQGLTDRAVGQIALRRFPEKVKEIQEIRAERKTRQITQIRNLKLQGLTRNEIAQEMGLSKGYVDDILKDHGQDLINIPKFTPEQEEEIVKDFKSGLKTIKELAREYDVDWKTLRSMLGLHMTQDEIENVQMQKQKERNEQITQVRNLKSQGLTRPAIAQQLGLSRGQVDDILADHGQDLIHIPKFTPEQEQKIVDDVTSRLKTINQVANELDVAHGTIEKVLLNHMTPEQVNALKDQASKRKGITLEDKKEMGKLFGEGKNSEYIASVYGINRSTVVNHLRSLPNYYSELMQLHIDNRPKDPNSSAAEKALFDLLEKSGVTNIQRNVKITRVGHLYYNMDGLHTSNPKVAIEFFGDLWHANPKRYSNPDQPLPRTRFTVGEIWKKDQSKIDYLESQGYQVIVVWESDWRTKAGKLNAINQIRKAFGLDPVSEDQLKQYLRS